METLGPTFELNRFIIRAVYLGVVSSLLLFLGQHEIRLRAEIERLARWPPVADADPELVAERLLAHAAGIVGANRALVVWESDQEPWIYVACWNAAASNVGKLAPDDIDPAVAYGGHRVEPRETAPLLRHISAPKRQYSVAEPQPERSAARPGIC